MVSYLRFYLLVHGVIAAQVGLAMEPVRQSSRYATIARLLHDSRKTGAPFKVNMEEADFKEESDFLVTLGIDGIHLEELRLPPQTVAPGCCFCCWENGADRPWLFGAVLRDEPERTADAEAVRMAAILSDLRFRAKGQIADDAQIERTIRAVLETPRPLLVVVQIWPAQQQANNLIAPIFAKHFGLAMLEE